jgi:ribosome-associated protein
MIELPDLTSEFVFTTSRSSGPGGQLVNKVETRVELRYDITNSVLLEERIKHNIINKLGTKINNDGSIIIASQIHRSQLKNKQECIKKMYELLVEAAIVEKPRKVTKTPKAVKEARLKEKKKTSDLKSMRGNLKGKI